jgi:hypothetical protein
MRVWISTATMSVEATGAAASRRREVDVAGRNFPGISILGIGRDAIICMQRASRSKTRDFEVVTHMHVGYKPKTRSEIWEATVWLPQKS